MYVGYILMSTYKHGPFTLWTRGINNFLYLYLPMIFIEDFMKHIGSEYLCLSMESTWILLELCQREWKTWSMFTSQNTEINRIQQLSYIK